MPHIYVDADACPVVKQIEKVAKYHNIPVTLFCDTNHVLSSNYSDVRIVGSGADAVDFALVNFCRTGDIVVPQDYGVAAMALAKGAYAMESEIMIEESERETIEKQLREICDAEQRQLGLEGVKLDIVFNDQLEEGNANPKTNTIKISLAKFLKTYEYALQNGHQSIRHELRHLWQRKNNKEHVEWWDAHGEYYDELIGDGKEYDYCTIEIDAEAYAKGSISQEYQLNKTTDELEMMMREYHENRSRSEQNNAEELSRIVSDYLENKKKLQGQY